MKDLKTIDELINKTIKNADLLSDTRKLHPDLDMTVGEFVLLVAQHVDQTMDALGRLSKKMDELIK